MQAIKLFSSYTKADNSTRYVLVLQDNTIWWYMPNMPWQQSPSAGLPENYNIQHLVGYAKGNDTRYVVVLEDNTIWWYMPNSLWQQSSTEGLPENFNIQHFDVYLKDNNQTRYVAVLEDNSIWWYMPNAPWQNSSTQGLEWQSSSIINQDTEVNTISLQDNLEGQNASDDSTL